MLLLVLFNFLLVAFMKYFTRKYSNAIFKYVSLPAMIRVYRKGKDDKAIAKVRVMSSKGKGKGVQITSNWMKVVQRSRMQDGEVFMFRFQGSQKEPGLKMVVEKLK